MSRRIAVPFANLRSSGWLTLGLFATALLYLVYFSQAWIYRGTMDYLGIDFRVFRASAQIAVESGYENVYDLGFQEQAQRPLFAANARYPSVQTFETVPMPYLPPFVLLFLPLLAVSPPVGFWISVLLNLGAVAILLRRYWPAWSPTTRLAGVVVATCLLSLPSVTNAAFGQVNVWIMICLGEFLLAGPRGRKLVAGLWLAGILIKPQLLVLLVPMIALAAEWRILLGFTAGLALILGGSIALAGFEGLAQLINLLLSYPANLPTTYPESMMNWRALGILLGPILDKGWDLIIVYAGTLCVIVLVLSLARQFHGETMRGYLVATLGGLAGGSLVAWHAHIHMALPLMLPMAGLVGQRLISEKPLALASVLLGSTFVFLGLIYGPGTAHVAAGLIMFAYNLALVFLSISLSIKKPLHHDSAA